MIRMHKLELHCHNSEVSACSHCPADTLIRRYLEAGYEGIVSTNHINRSTFRSMDDLTWQQKIDHFMRGYEALLHSAPADFPVLLGCEINLTPSGWPAYIPNDYLVFGVTEEWLRQNGDLRDMKLEDLSAYAHSAGLLLIHAHPFRCGTVVVKPDLLDGYEVCNGNPRHDSHNDLAAFWAKRNDKIAVSGSDFHQPDDPPCCGIETEEMIRDHAALLKTLISGQYRLLKDK